MHTHLTIPMVDAEIYQPALKAILHDRLEPLPGRPERGISVGTTVLAQNGCETEVETEFYVWMVDATTGLLKQGDLMNASTALRDQCGTPAFAALGDIDVIKAIRDAVERMMPFSLDTTYEAICLPQGILILAESLVDAAYAEACTRQIERLDAAALSKVAGAICPADASNHERLEFSRVATDFIARRIRWDVEKTLTRSRATLLEGVAISVSPERHSA